MYGNEKSDYMWKGDTLYLGKKKAVTLVQDDMHLALWRLCCKGRIVSGPLNRSRAKDAAYARAINEAKKKELDK